jgi:hypothetical protein
VREHATDDIDFADHNGARTVASRHFAPDIIAEQVE